MTESVVALNATASFASILIMVFPACFCNGLRDVDPAAYKVSRTGAPFQGSPVSMVARHGYHCRIGFISVAAANQSDSVVCGSCLDNIGRNPIRVSTTIKR